MWFWSGEQQKAFKILFCSTAAVASSPPHTGTLQKVDFFCFLLLACCVFFSRRLRPPCFLLPGRCHTRRRQGFFCFFVFSIVEVDCCFFVSRSLPCR